MLNKNIIINLIQILKFEGGLYIDKRKKIKYKGKSYSIKVDTYPNDRICINLINKNDIKELTINLKDEYLENGKIFLDPAIKTNGLFKELKKTRIIKDICGILNYNYVNVPIATLNMGILRKYDNIGVSNYLDKISNYRNHFDE